MTAAPIRMTAASPCPEKDRIFFALSVPEPNVGILPLLRNQSFHTETVCNGYCFTYLLRFVFFCVLSVPQMFVMCVYEDRHKKIKNEHLHTKKTKIA